MTTPAIILAHPSAPVHLDTPPPDPREQPVHDPSLVLRLQSEESYRRDTLAEEAAKIIHGQSIDRLPLERRINLRAGAAYLIRRPVKAWREAAMDQAVPVVASMLVENLKLSPEAAALLAVPLTAFAVTTYEGVLEGMTPLSPGAYLRASQEETR